jgi:hypothetical protein
MYVRASRAVVSTARRNGGGERARAPETLPLTGRVSAMHRRTSRDSTSLCDITALTMDSCVVKPAR